MFNSRFTEYQFAEWRRRRNNLFVTIETAVPEMPKKVLEEPDLIYEAADCDGELGDQIQEEHEVPTSCRTNPSKLYHAP